MRSSQQQPDLTLREVYPDAPTDAPIRIFRPRRNVFNYATFWRFTKISAATVAVIGFIGYLLLIGWATFGKSAHTASGVGATQSDTSPVGAIAGLLLFGSIWLMCAIAIVQIITATIIRSGRRSTNVDAHDFMTARGFHTRDAATWERLPVPAFNKMDSLDIHHLFAGHLADGIPALVGTADGHRETQNMFEDFFDDYQFATDNEHQHFVFVYSLLPPHVQSESPGSSFVRVARPMSTWLELGGHELELESIRVDTSTHISVEGSTDALVWRQLFGPQFLAGLADVYDVQWQQHGSVMVFFAPTTWTEHDVLEQELDTLMAGAAFVLRHYLETVDRVRRSQRDDVDWAA